MSTYTDHFIEDDDTITASPGAGPYTRIRIRSEDGTTLTLYSRNPSQLNALILAASEARRALKRGDAA